MPCLLGEYQIFTGFDLQQRGHACFGSFKFSYSLNPQDVIGCIYPEDMAAFQRLDGDCVFKWLCSALASGEVTITATVSGVSETHNIVITPDHSETF